MSAGSGASARLTQDSREQDVVAGQLGMGLQLIRANSLTMMRLHLALQSGDRRLAMMAMDGLMDIDAEIEGFVEDLVGRPDNDAHWQALTGYLEHQKAAIAVEKHALVGAVGRVEAPAVVAPSMAVVEEFPVSPPAVVEVAEVAALPEEQEEEVAPRRFPVGWTVGLVLFGLVVAIVVALMVLGKLPGV